MKKNFLRFANSTILKYYPSLNDDEMEVIDYGLESVYLTFTKLIVILALSFFLGITKQVLLILIFYNIIRFTAFGIHATKSSYCLLSSCIFLIGGVYICNYSINITLIIKVILCFICIISIYLYAPADTHKRPIVNIKKRKRIHGVYKIK